MARAALFEFSTSSAAEIVSAIDAKITTIQNLHAFRTRMGGAKKADRLYPHTREALNIIKTLRQQSKDAKANCFHWSLNLTIFHLGWLSRRMR